MKKVLLVKYGEIALRGKNRGLFENKIIDVFLRQLKDLDGYKVKKEQGRLLVEKTQGCVDYDLLMPRVKNILGVSGFCECVKTEDQDIENLKAIALAYMQENFPASNFKFKVETKRADKKYPLRSQEVSSLIGGAIAMNMPNSIVNVSQPDVVLMVELRSCAYLYAKASPGLGGLPAGSSGRGMLLLSGGIDSPVAGFLMAKRGVALEAVYFHAPPFTSPRAEEKVHDLCGRLADFTGNITLHVVHFTDVQTYLYEHVPEVKLTIFLKRAMLHIASKLAAQNRCNCLITGDSIGQVASQTMEAICATNTATSLPVMRPLCGFDKQEIVNIAQKIGTYDISIRPYEDCCTIFVAKHPETKPKISVIEGMERRLSEWEEKINSVSVVTHSF